MQNVWFAGKPQFIRPSRKPTRSRARFSKTVFDGRLILRFSGTGAERLLRESGGHRWQGKSGGKIHTSTVTVAALREREPQIRFDRADVQIIRTKDSGNGGQNRNKRLTCVVAIHTPTGLSAKCAERQQGQNLENALAELERRVRESAQQSWQERLNTQRQRLIGSGERGDKIRTYREQDEVVIDHRSGQKMRLKDILNGRL